MDTALTAGQRWRTTMNDLIDRHAAISYAISGRVMILPSSEGGEEKWIRTKEVRQSLLDMPSASPNAELTALKERQSKEKIAIIRKLEKLAGALEAMRFFNSKETNDALLGVMVFLNEIIENLEVVDTKTVEELPAQLKKKKGELQKKSDQLRALQKDKDFLEDDLAKRSEQHQEKTNG